MHIDQIPLDHLSVSKANMRIGKKPPDISDILPSVIKRGVISPLFVRSSPALKSGEGGNAGHFEIIAGQRRYYASLEAAKLSEDGVTLPCIVLGEGGRSIKQISMESRKEFGEIIGKPVHLFLHVKVRDSWQNDPERYREMGLDFPKA